MTWYASRRDSGDVLELPARLADAFDAEGAGLAGPLRGRHAPVFAWWKNQPADKYPWQDKAFPLPASGSVVREGERTWLLASLGEPLDGSILAWAAFSSPLTSSDLELDQLAAAGLLLWQALKRSSPAHPWLWGIRQKHLDDRNEHAARIAGKLAHDFGNLLTGILGFSELAKSQVASGSHAHQFVSEILAASLLGASWIHRLQVFGRRTQPKNECCDFREAARLEEHRLRPLWQGRAQLHLAIPENLPRLGMGAAAVQMTLAPVLDNAFEALEESDAVYLVARETCLDDNSGARIVGQPRPARYVEVSVTNTGSPLPRALLEGRLDDCCVESRKRQRGLGLPVSYGVLMNYGGGMAFQQDAPRTATVRLYLPVQAESAGLIGQGA